MPSDADNLALLHTGAGLVRQIARGLFNAVGRCLRHWAHQPGQALRWGLA